MFDSSSSSTKDRSRRQSLSRTRPPSPLHSPPPTHGIIFDLESGEESDDIWFDFSSSDDEVVVVSRRDNNREEINEEEEEINEEEEEEDEGDEYELEANAADSDLDELLERQPSSDEDDESQPVVRKRLRKTYAAPAPIELDSDNDGDDDEDSPPASSHSRSRRAPRQKQQQQQPSQQQQQQNKKLNALTHEKLQELSPLQALRAVRQQATSAVSNVRVTAAEDEAEGPAPVAAVECFTRTKRVSRIIPAAFSEDGLQNELRVVHWKGQGWRSRKKTAPVVGDHPKTEPVATEPLRAKNYIHDYYREQEWEEIELRHTRFSDIQDLKDFLDNRNTHAIQKTAFNNRRLKTFIQANKKAPKAVVRKGKRHTESNSIKTAMWELRILINWYAIKVADRETMCKFPTVRAFFKELTLTNVKDWYKYLQDDVGYTRPATIKNHVEGFNKILLYVEDGDDASDCENEIHEGDSRKVRERKTMQQQQTKRLRRERDRIVDFVRKERTETRMAQNDLNRDEKNPDHLRVLGVLITLDDFRRLLETVENKLLEFVEEHENLSAVLRDDDRVMAFLQASWTKPLLLLYQSCLIVMTMICAPANRPELYKNLTLEDLERRTDRTGKSNYDMVVHFPEKQHRSNVTNPRHRRFPLPNCMTQFYDLWLATVRPLLVIATSRLVNEHIFFNTLGGLLDVDQVTEMVRSVVWDVLGVYSNCRSLRFHQTAHYRDMKGKTVEEMASFYEQQGHTAQVVELHYRFYHPIPRERALQGNTFHLALRDALPEEAELEEQAEESDASVALSDDD
jgi:hypothetical protein